MTVQKGKGRGKTFKKFKILIFCEIWFIKHTVLCQKVQKFVFFNGYLIGKVLKKVLNFEKVMRKILNR